MLRIVPAGVDDPQVRALLTLHAERARAETGRGSAHALDADGLKAPGMTLLAAWDGEALAGVGALKALGGGLFEIKSMHVAEAMRGRGVGRAIVERLTALARDQGATAVSLETGSWAYFAPARALYAACGFGLCSPFGDYVDDPNSVFMTRAL